jgi:hypothetical protein
MKKSGQSFVLWLAQIGINAALLALVVWWFTWPDARAWQVIGSFAAAAGIFFVALWLCCGTLACFAGDGGLLAGFRQSLRRLPAFLLWLMVLGALLWVLEWSKSLLPQMSVRFAQLTHLSPRTLMKVGIWKIFVLQWIVVPAMLLPFASSIAARGFGGWRLRAWRQLRRVSYWLTFFAALLAGVYAPCKLINWRPVLHEASMRREAWSMGLRFAAAYVLCVTSWVVLAGVMGWQSRNLQQNDHPIN